MERPGKSLPNVCHDSRVTDIVLITRPDGRQEAKAGMATDDAHEAAREAGERIKARIERTGDDAKAAGARIRDFIEETAEKAAEAAKDVASTVKGKAEDAGDAAKAAWEKVRGDDAEKA